MRTHNFSRTGNKKLVYLSLFVAILLVIGAYYVVLAYTLSDSNNASEEPSQPREVGIATLGSATEAFEKGYIDVLVTFRPEVSTVTREKGGSVLVKFFITCHRRDPAPEVIELRLDPDSSATYIPRDKNSTPADLRTYLRVNDYISYKPEVIRIRDGETAEAWITIEFTDNFLRALNYNRRLGHGIPIPIGVYAIENAENLGIGFMEEAQLELVP